jgi:lipoate-protein ligase A
VLFRSPGPFFKDLIQRGLFTATADMNRLSEPDAILMERLLLALRTGYRPTRVPSRPRPTTTLVEAWGRVPDREDLAQTIANATSRLLKRPLRRGNITQSEEDRARNLTREKYGRDEWNLSR